MLVVNWFSRSVGGVISPADFLYSQKMIIMKEKRIFESQLNLRRVMMKKT